MAEGGVEITVQRASRGWLGVRNRLVEMRLKMFVNVGVLIDAANRYGKPGYLCSLVS